jgi:DNA invertase Pin-like site-specific DNA recombinase
VQELTGEGITIHFIKEGFNTGNGNDICKFLLNILGAVIEMEREPASRRY